MSRNSRYDELIALLEENLHQLKMHPPDHHEEHAHRDYMSHAGCSHPNRGNAGKVARARCRRQRRYRSDTKIAA